jgi:hypothetical protein
MPHLSEPEPLMDGSKRGVRDGASSGSEGPVDKPVRVGHANKKRRVMLSMPKS